MFVSAVILIHTGWMPQEGTEEPDTTKPLYLFARASVDGSYQPFDPFGEGDGDSPPQYSRHAAVQRFGILASTDSRISVPPPVYEELQAMTERSSQGEGDLPPSIVMPEGNA